MVEWTVQNNTLHLIYIISVTRATKDCWLDQSENMDKSNHEEI